MPIHIINCFICNARWPCLDFSTHGQSGSMLVLDNLGALLGKSIPLAIGFIAESYGLGLAMWVLLVGPVALFLGLPRRNPIVNADTLEP